MTEGKFNKDDKDKLVEFLNQVALNAEFKFKTVELIKYYKLLAHMQTVILPKIDGNILEVIAVHEPALPTLPESEE